MFRWYWCKQMPLLHKILSNRARAAALAVSVAVLAFVIGVAEAKAETLILGTVGKDAKAELKEFTPLAKYLQDQLTGSGMEQVEVLVLPTAGHMSEAFRQGTVHLYFESPLVAAKVGLDGGAVPMLRRWRKGVAEYWSEILVRSEAEIRSLDDLRGRVIAFDDPDSTSGYLLPRAMLLDRGLHIQLLKRPDEPVDPAKVGGVFMLSDKASILSLFGDRVAAIATDQQYMKKIEEERPGAVRSIGRSIPVPRHVVMRAAAMPQERVRRIAEVLAGMNHSEEGRRVLALFGKTDRFDHFPEGVEATFTPIRAQLRLLEADPGS